MAKKERSGEKIETKEAAVRTGWGRAEQRYSYRYDSESEKPDFYVFRWERDVDGKKEKKLKSFRVVDGVMFDAGHDQERPRPMYWANRRAVSSPIKYIVEGEKTVRALDDFGVYNALSPFMGDNIKKTDYSCLTGSHVVIIPDNDVEGFKNAMTVAEEAGGKEALAVEVVYPPLKTRPRGWDWGDYAPELATSGTILTPKEQKEKCLFEFNNYVKNNSVSAEKAMDMFREDQKNETLARKGEGKEARAIIKEQGFASPKTNMDDPKKVPLGLVDVSDQTRRAGGKIDENAPEFKVIANSCGEKGAIAHISASNGWHLYNIPVSELKQSKHYNMLMPGIHKWVKKFYLKSYNKKGEQVKTKTFNEEHCQIIHEWFVNETLDAPAWDQGSVRKRGVWKMDSGKLAINFGNGVAIWDYGDSLIKKDPASLSNTEGLHFVQDKTVDIDIGNPMSEDDGKRIAELFNRWEIKGKGIKDLVAGFTFVSCVAGALPYRPHIWIAANTGAGKSEFINNMINPLISTLSEHYAGNATSAAAMNRQTGNVSGMIENDEAEADSSNAALERRKGIMEILRQSATGNGKAVTKCFGDTVKDFYYSSTFLIASTTRDILGPSDENRILEVNMVLDYTKRDARHFLNLKNEIAAFLTPEMGARFRGRAVRMYKIIIENYNLAKCVIGGLNGGDMRGADLHGMMLAGYFSMTQDEAASEEQMITYIKENLTIIISDKEPERESKTAIYSVLEADVQCLKERHKVKELINIAIYGNSGSSSTDITSSEAMHYLVSNGLKISEIIDENDEPTLMLIIAKNHIALRKILVGSPVAGKNYYSLLSREFGTKFREVKESFGGPMYDALEVPIDNKTFQIIHPFDFEPKDNKSTTPNGKAYAITDKGENK